MLSLPTYPLINFAAQQAFTHRLKLSPAATPRPQPAAEPVALYLHIPFCESLCSFCTFHRQLLDEPLARAYFAALRQELTDAQQQGWQVGQVYIGGGTPTVLIDELCQTLALSNRLFSNPPTSVETNPNHLRPEILQPLLDHGVSRLSVGVQSFDARLLSRMNRLQPYGQPAQIRDRLALANALFPTLNVDMIFNLPGQSEASLHNDLQTLKSLAIKQISWYPLMPNRVNRQPLHDSLGDYQRRHEWASYRLLATELADDYRASSAWCYSRKALHESDEYIVNFPQYLGLGSGAFSAIGRNLLASTFSINDYIRRIGQSRSPIVARQHFTDTEWLQYQLLLQLFALRPQRQYEGTARQQALWHSQMQALRLLGAVRKTGHQWQVTLRGRYLALVLMREFFSAVNRLREQMLQISAAEQRIQTTELG